MLAEQKFDIIALVETWHLSLDRDFTRFCFEQKYNILQLPAILAVAGHNKGGILVLVRKCFKLTGILKERCYFGEQVQFILDDTVRLTTVYRRPECQKAEDFDNTMQFFNSSYDTVIPTFYIGDFNWQQQIPQHKSSGPVLLRDCQVYWNDMEWSNRQQKSITDRLKTHNLVVFSPLVATHTKGRCLDYVYGSIVCKNRFNVDCNLANSFVSDHSGLTLTLTSRTVIFPSVQAHGVSPQQMITTFKIGRTNNKAIVLQNAVDILYRLYPFVQQFSHAPSVGIGVLGLCVYAAFTAAQKMVLDCRPSHTPSYTAIYRSFKRLTSNIRCLRSCKQILQAQKYKYNIKTGYLLKRNILYSSYTHRGFYDIINTGKTDTVVEASQQDIAQHFTRLFNKTSNPPAIDADFLQDFIRLDNLAIQDLQRDFDVDELKVVVSGMAAKAAVGSFGVDVETVRWLLESPLYGPLVCEFLLSMLHGTPDQQLLTSLLTAIPKTDLPTSEASNLRPISVTSVWYRILTRLFTQRLHTYIPDIYSTEQHGFCPGRSTITAMGSIVPVVEKFRSEKRTLFLAAVDVNKAYDSVCRQSLASILGYIGLANNPFIHLILRAMAEGPITITGSQGLSDWLWTTCGIKQGCPASPTLFGIIMSGLQRRLWRLQKEQCITVQGYNKSLFSYADDLKLMASSVESLQLLFKEVCNYLEYFGLSITTKCNVLVIGHNNLKYVRLNGIKIKCVENMRFLGLKITNTGGFLPWRDSYSTTIYGIKGRLTAAGLGAVPSALSRAIQIKILPAMLYGCEVWSSTWLRHAVAVTQSPYIHPRMKEIINFLKSYLKLPQKSFHAMVYKILNIPSMLHLILPRFIKFITTLSPEQWECIDQVAAQLRSGFCFDLVCIREWWQHEVTSLGLTSGSTLCSYKLVGQLETMFWESQEEGSRHSQFYAIFKTGQCLWPFVNGHCSYQTLTTCSRFFTLQNPYFWARGKKLCKLCQLHPATLSHLLCECSEIASIRQQFDIPTEVVFLRVFLLTATARQLFTLVEVLEQKLSSYVDVDLPVSATPPPIQLNRDIACWTIEWDGSFNGIKAGVGIVIKRGDLVVLEVSVPVYASDASRCEALGPALAALLLSRVGWTSVKLRGDSLLVVKLLRKEIQAQDIWLFNCTEITLDLLSRGNVAVDWIPRESNTQCDGLARRAVACGDIFLKVHGDYEVEHARWWQRICMEFCKRFDLSSLYPQRVECVIQAYE